MPLHAYLINLDRDPDRHAHMAAEFARVGVSYVRVPAILGLAMPEWVKPYFLAGDSIASALKPGEVGCYASHLVVARALLDLNLPYALICEDDLTFPADFLPLIEAALSAMEPGWDILRLSNQPKAPYVVLAPLPAGRDLVLYSRVPNNTGCHLLSRSGAQKLLAPGLRSLQIDEHLRRPWRLGMETYGIAPAPVISNIFDSTLDKISDRGLAKQGWLTKTLRRDRGNPADWFAQIRWSSSHLGAIGVAEAVARGVLHSAIKALAPASQHYAQRILRMRG